MPDLLNLSEREIVAALVKYGSYTFSVAAGKRLNLRYWSPGETDILDVTVPVGKAWNVTVSVEIRETDV